MKRIIIRLAMVGIVVTAWGLLSSGMVNEWVYRLHLALAG